MSRRVSVYTMIAKVSVAAALAASFGLAGLSPQPAQAQITAFLGTPYYGNATTISQWFGGVHSGIDFRLSYERVLAAADGAITEVRWYNTDPRCLQDRTDQWGCGYGLHIRISHAGNYLTIYGHLSAAVIQPGNVDLGQIIGTSGDNGYSTGDHLHFEVRHNGVAVDPFNEGGVSLWAYGACTQKEDPPGDQNDRCSGTPFPAPAEAETITIDDGDPGFTRGFTTPTDWTYATDVGYNGDTYYGFNTTSTTVYRWARWQLPSTSRQGVYEIKVHVPRNHATTWWGKYAYTVIGSLAVVDQAELFDQWVTIGRLPLGPGAIVELTSQTENFDTNRLVAADAVRFVRLAPTYLPDIRATGGWDSTIIVRSNGGDALVSVEFYNSDGQLRCSTGTSSMPASGTWSTNASWCPDARSAVVAASQDVSVVVENYNLYTSSAYAYNGIAAADALNPGWGQVGTTVYLPDLMDNNYGWSTSVTILNAGSGTATFDFDYYGQNSGGPYQGPQGSLGPNASVTYSQYGSTCPTVGAGHISSDQPLAVIVGEYSGNVSMAYNGFNGGATPANLPLIMANNYGWLTGIAVQNLGSAATDVTVNYYPSPGYPNRNPETVYNVQPNATAILVQSGGQWGSTRWVGSARVTASQPIAAIVNEIVSGKGSSYSGFAGGSSLVVLPDVRSDGSWTSGIQVQNLDGNDAAVAVRVSGNNVWAGTIGGYQSVTISSSQIVGSGFRGPVIVECTNGRRIAAVVNLYDPSSAADGMMTYDGINR